MKRGGQYGYSGHVCSFSQDVKSFAKTLPLSMNDLSNILIVKRGSQKDFNYFILNKSRVLRALNWLQKHNKYYKDIVIDMKNLEDLSEVSNELDYLPSINNFMDENDSENIDDVNAENFFTSSDVPELSVFNVKSKVNQFIGLQWPERSENPINEFEENGLICKSFPHLFSRGKADYNEQRFETVTLKEYFKHLMLYKDERFSKDVRFRFYALKRLMRMQTNSNSSICIKKNDLNNFTIPELKKKIEKEPDFIKKILCYNQNIRGSSSYWFQQSFKLKSMIRQLGLPTFFVTLTAADFYWKNFSLYLDPDIDYSNLSNNEAILKRCKLINDNPLKSSWFFHMRSDYFIKKILIPKLKIQDWWYRTEFQSRGSPHIHGLFWLENSPNY